MALYVYRVADGTLYSWSPEDDSPVAPDDELAANGFGKVTGLPPLDRSHAWDEATRTVIEIIPIPDPVQINPAELIMRFTPEEFQAIIASTDASIAQWVFVLQCAMNVNLVDPQTIAVIDQMVQLNLITEVRKAAILATP